ncbi:UNVERIFIED_CONTAM: hypothetical protein GTU68_037184, partial [Idotea baltica]|nr:hypothetical protein [Idotea baltica]
MKYLGRPEYAHGTGEKLGILVVNLGTPDAPDTKSVRRYLRQFLSDPRIIELPRILWMAILHGVILRVRPAKSAEAYQEVWSDETGSPLMSISLAQAGALQHNLQDQFGSDVIVKLGMRYGSPSIDQAISELESENVRRMLVLPILCHKTTRLLAQELGLGEKDYRVVFQSRVGKEEWLRPYCDETM